jgi:hypothetical protein
MSSRTAAIIVDADIAQAWESASTAKKKQLQVQIKKWFEVSEQAKKKVPQTRVPRLSKRESELFLKINRTLPEDEQRRYDELMEKRVEETLTKKEHMELLKLIEELQQIWVERWQAVIDLAKLRKISPQEMMRQLGVDPEKYG